ncbi:MAG: phosphoribosylamine--glycine ligase, partial [Pseudobdellovibrionaceae bacterium]
MKVLVLGSGGREHALVKALNQSPSVTEVHVIPGNAGMTREALCHSLDWKNTEEIIKFCNRTEIDYVMVGPEDPLVAGIGDLLRERGILVVGPSREGAQLEGSKIFAKEFMIEAKVPTAPYFIVESVEQTLKAAKDFPAPYVLKADGLAAGKGVFICKTLEDLKAAATDLFEKRILGAAGSRALLEKFMPGWELSFLVLTNGSSYEVLPLAQDHKRLSDGDQGPNTGGMGTVAPLKISAGLREQIENQIIKPSVQLMDQKNLIFSGVLFVGIMVTEQGAQVLYFNTRFGDPETQVILTLLEGDWGR